MFRVRKQFEFIENAPVEDSAFYKQFSKMAATLGIVDDYQPEVTSIQKEAKESLKMELDPMLDDGFQKLPL